jgi:hypothetical protein
MLLCLDGERLAGDRIAAGPDERCLLGNELDPAMSEREKRKSPRCSRLHVSHTISLFK